MTVAQTQTTAQFDTALRTLAHQAATRYPGEQARIDRGLVIALNGGVTFAADGTALVRSQRDPEVVYTVNGHCDCPDATRVPDGRCKHRWAKTLTRRALAPTHTRTAWYAEYQGVYGQAIQDAYGAWTFVSDDDAVQRLTPAQVQADLMRFGAVREVAEQRRLDLEAQTDLAVIETHNREARILAA